jgi:hypothetical protein
MFIQISCMYSSTSISSISIHIFINVHPHLSSKLHPFTHLCFIFYVHPNYIHLSIYLNQNLFSLM